MRTGLSRKPRHLEALERLDRMLLTQVRRKRVPSWEQLKFLPRLLSKGEKGRIIAALLLCAVVVSIMGTRIWWRATVPVPARGGTYTEGLVGSPRFINPLLAPSNDVDRDISSLVFSGLLRTDEKGAIVPDLAAAYSVSPDGKTYTVELKENVLWQDDQPLSIDDVLYTFQAVQNPSYKSPLRVSLSGVSISRVNGNTLSFTLREPLPSFLSVLTTGIIPEHVWYPIPVASAHLAEANIKPVGSGPYRFAALTKDSNGIIRSMTLARNESYHDTKPYIEKIIFKFYPDFQTAIEAFKNKNVDGISFLPLEFKDDLASKASVTISSLSLPQYTAIFFNPEKNELLKEKNFRRALALSVDRERILSEALAKNGMIINSPVLPGAIGYDPNAPASPYAPDEAKKILDGMGWKAAEGGIRTKDSKELTVKLTTVDQRENTQALSIIKENWESAGIKTELEIIPRSKIKKDIIEPRAYELLLFSQIIGMNQDPFAFWHSSQTRQPGNNLSILGNKDIDAVLSALRTTTDAAELAKLYRSFQEKLTENVFAVFLYNPAYLYPQSKRIKGHDGTQRISVPSDRFNGIRGWYVQTARKRK